MVYGMVQYDFNAERPDELDAKAGEHIIIIAQSNPEWFVAKPIGRLGGPGLIPVSFIEIKDAATGEVVTDVQAAIQRAGVPKVEEWKKMAADYKNSSITLGKFEAANAASIQRDLERMSLNNGTHQQATTNGGSFVSLFEQLRNAPDSRSFRVTISRTTNATQASQHKAATTDSLNVPCMPLSPPRFQDTALKMTSTGTSSSASLKTASIGSFLAITRISMTSKLRFSKNSRLRQTRREVQGFYLTCQAR